MTEFEQVLQECLYEVEEGIASVDECLARYPRYARELEPILVTSAYLAQGRELRLSPAFKARVRTRLIEQMRARPRKVARSGFLLMRLATGFAALLLVLLSAGTVYAQSALPGNAFYGWKLASENIWRMVSADPLETDLLIAQRRTDELIAVHHEPALYAQALREYLEVVSRLEARVNTENAERIRAALDSQIEQLNQADIFPEETEPGQEILPTVVEPTLIPATTPPPVLETPWVNPTQVAPVIPTVDIPEPTLGVPPVNQPTLESLPDIVPTVEIPPLIP